MPQFRGIVDLRFGMGLSVTRIADPRGRDRLLLRGVFTTALRFPSGAVGRNPGMHGLLKFNTSRTRMHALFCSGCRLYELDLNKLEHWLGPLLGTFAAARWPYTVSLTAI